ncbi:MAG TPA: FkbM family methyltransferase [Bacteroidia bacterium]|jgi:FkbM family methyltransferase|nr:FkbM family methyltransferase [Bacteroidia bacterium]
MKTAIKFVLHSILGFQNYLYLFSMYKIRTLRKDRKEGDFFFFLDQLPETGTVLDIGANIGIMTVHMAASGKRQVIAFEPMPYNLKTLYRIIARYKLQNVTVEECALGNENGFTEMVMPKVSGVRMQGLSHVVHETIEENNEGDKVKVKIQRLDDLPVLKALGSLTGIKMDVENFESFVLEGSLTMLRKHKPVLYIELWDNENRKRCFELLGDLGYLTYIVQEGKLVRFTGQDKQNFIFLPGTSVDNKA